VEELTPEVLIKMYQEAEPYSSLPILGGLDDIDWSSLEHAHGAAIDVPPLFRALFSENESHRDFACRLLHETIWHQGSIYEASLATIPFLFRFMESPRTNVRSCAASLLAALADGSHYLKYLASDEADGEQIWREILSKQGLDLETEITKEARVVTAAKATIGQDLHKIFAYIKDSEPKVRRAIASLFRFFPDKANDTIPLLKEALAVEQDHWAKKAMLESLSLLSA
jgi:hypothetical protein